MTANVTRRRLVLALIIGGLLPRGSWAGGRSRPVRIGALSASWGPTPQMAGMRDLLLERGYREVGDFDIGVRFTQGDLSALGEAARQLLAFPVDMLFTSGSDAARAAKQATATIPIVFTGPIGDPVRAGLVQTYGRPGGNVTGVTDLDLDLCPKRLELLREMVPGLKRALFPFDSADDYSVVMARTYSEAGRRLGVGVVDKPCRTTAEARWVVAASRRDVQAIVVPSSLSFNIPGVVLDATLEKPIPTMFNAAFWAEKGALASYGPDLYVSGRQAGRLVEKIMSGVPPADIPVEANPKIEFTINRKTAQILRLSLPLGVVNRADRLL